MPKTITILLLSVLLTGCVKMPDLAQAWEIAEKVERTLACQRIAAHCIDMVSRVDMGHVTGTDIALVQGCAIKWEDNNCSQAVAELTDAAGALCAVER